MVMVVLTFFSSTINNLTLPRVQTARPTSGALIKEIFGEGTVEAKSIWEEYALTNLRVKEVMVGVGDRVSKGQPILSLDIEALKANYLDEQARYQQLQLSLAVAREELEQKQQDEEARYQQLQLSLAGAREELAQKQRDYNILKVLFDNGAETAVNLQDAEKKLVDAERNCENIQLNLEIQGRKVEALNKQAETGSNYDNIQLNLEIQARKVESLAKQVENNGVYTAPVDGIVTELNFAKGSMTNNSMPLFKLTDPQQGLRMVVPIASDLADYVQPGDALSVNVFSLGDKKTQGKIERIVENSQHKGEKKDLWIDVSLEGLAGGEKGEIYLSKRTKQYNALVPNSAVYYDSDGSYVFLLKSRKGPLGTENYLQKLAVNVEDSDNAMSALTSLVMGEVVIQSNKPVDDGARVLKEAAN